MDVGKPLVDGVAFRLNLHHVTARLHHLGEGVIHLIDISAELKVLPQIVAGECDGATGVFLLRIAQQIGGETDLRLHLLFAVAEVIVGNQRDHDPGGVPAGQLKAAAVVVALLPGLPAHAVPFLPIGGLGNMRQAELFFAKHHQVRGKHHATGVAGPVERVKGSVVFSEVRIAGVSKNRLHKIQVGNQAARRKKTGLQRARFANAPDPGHHLGPQQQ